MAFELRDLNAMDFGTVCNILSKVGVKQFGKCFDVRGIKETDVEKVGYSVAFDIAGIVIENMGNAEKEIQSFLASLTGLSIAEIRKLPFADYGELIISVCMKEEFKDFFGRALKLFTT